MSLEFQRAGLPVFIALALPIFAVSLTSTGNRIFAVAERSFSRLAERKGRAILFVAAAAILLRVAILPFIPVPVPQVHDEFSYLLEADTFANGRLTNPPHPMWIYFDTFHVNQLPTYMSKYPPAQGLALAAGEVLGHPWIGVLLSVAAMTAAIVWALQAWMSPAWALLGGFLVLSRFGIFGYWINSYWGGAVAALGGALVIGAFARILQSWRPVDALILGVGEAILANSRPFEGLIFSIPLFVVLLIAMFLPEAPPRTELISRFAAPFATVMILCFAFMGYYNWRGTGNPLLFPYTLNDSVYLSATPEVLWLHGTPPRHFENPQFEAFYNGAVFQDWEQGRASNISKARSIFANDLRTFVRFLIGPQLYIPFLAVLLILRNRYILFFVTQTVLCFCCLLLVSWFQPHYVAPLLVTVIALIVEGLRYVRTWDIGNYRFGTALSRALVFCAVVLTPFQPWGYQKVGATNRSRVARDVTNESGKQLVIVHYSAEHDPHQEWVYNRAKIDDAKIVWAREIPDVSLTPLLNYFHGYHVWIVDPDSPTPTPRPYSGSASAN